MSQSTQTYTNHRQINFFSVTLILISAVLVVLQCVSLFTSADVPGPVVLLILNIVVLFALFSARLGSLTVQDRLIMLEMRLRLEKILPDDLQSEIPKLTKGNLIALRFASDAEMEGLVRRVLSGELSTQKEIKLAVKDWQADHQRV